MSKFNYVNNKKREEYAAKLTCEFLKNRMPEIGQFDSMASPVDDMCRKFDFYTAVLEKEPFKDPLMPLKEIVSITRHKIQLKVRSKNYISFNDIITRLTPMDKTWISEVNSGEADYIIECFLDTEDAENSWRGASIIGVHVLDIGAIKRDFTIVPYLSVDSIFLSSNFKAAIYPTSRFGAPLDKDILLIPVKSFGKNSYGLRFEKDMINEYCPGAFKSFLYKED